MKYDVVIIVYVSSQIFLCQNNNQCSEFWKRQEHRKRRSLFIDENFTNLKIKK